MHKFGGPGAVRPTWHHGRAGAIKQKFGVMNAENFERQQPSRSAEYMINFCALLVRHSRVPARLVPPRGSARAGTVNSSSIKPQHKGSNCHEGGRHHEPRHHDRHRSGYLMQVECVDLGHTLEHQDTTVGHSQVQ